MTLYRTQITFYHRDVLTEVDQSVLISQASQYACLNEVLVYWIECKQEPVTEEVLEEEIGEVGGVVS